MYLTVVAMASLLVMAFNLNSSMNAHASIFSNIQNADDIGQSLECVIVVVGCDGTGSVGSSGDVIIGSGDNNTNGNGNGDHTVCEECLSEALTPEQEAALLLELEVLNLAEACVAIAELDATALLTILTGIGLTVDAALELLACLGIDAPPVIVE